MATRPLLVPCYLVAARLSVPLVHGRRRRLSLEQAPNESDEADPFPSEAAPVSVEIDEWPVVSVVIPVLNGEKVIGRCLDSIRALDYPRERLEVIVADNGSTDQTAEIARSYDVVVVVEPKPGAAAARNAGIAAARGEWVATTDADCVVHPLWLRQLVAVALREQSSAVGGRILSVCREAVVKEFCAREDLLDQQAAVEGRMLSFPFVITANGLFRREAIVSMGGFDEEFTDAAAEDVDLGWRLDERGDAFAYAPNAWVCHRQRERGVDIHAQYYRYGLSEVRLYLKHRHRLSPRDLAKHLWIRPILYRNFWNATWHWATTPPDGGHRDRRRLWRLVVLKELGHMAGKMEGGRRWRTWRHFRLWTYE